MQKMKILGIALAAVVGLVLVTGCTVTTANIESVTLGSAINEESQEVMDETTAFKQDAPIIYASVSIANAPEDTNFIGEWYYDGENGLELLIEIAIG